MADVIERPASPAEIEPEVAATNGHAPSETGSLMASLRAKRDALAEERHLELEVPGYEGMLAVRYKPVEFSAVMEIFVRISAAAGDHKLLLPVSADFLILCCDEVLGRVDGELVSLRHAPGVELDGPVRFEKSLAEAFGYEADSAREVLYGLFRNDFAVVTQQRRVYTWLERTNEEINEDF